MIEQVQRRLIAGLMIGVVVVLAVVLISDGDALAEAFRSFDWRLVPAVIILTLLNYALRFVKWQYYLRLLDVRDLSWPDSLRVFVAGFTMVMTPGKVGELLKSYLVRVRTGTPMARTAPIIFAERLTDGIAMLVLAGIGLTVFTYGWQLMLVGAVVSVGGLILLQHDALMHRILAAIGRTGFGRGRAETMTTLYESTRSLLRPRPFATAVGIGVVSWLGECLAFFLILVGLGIPATPYVLVASIFVFAAAAWIGAASMLPGGLGVAELSVAGLLLLTIDDPAMTSSTAAAATLLIRFATLWFGVILGVVALSRVSSWTSTVPASDAESMQAIGPASR
jgi:uncharacterized protein (TIRG00374 family)